MSVHIYQKTRHQIPENTTPHSDIRGSGKPLRPFLSFSPYFYFLFFYHFILFFCISCFLSTHMSLSVFLLFSIYFLFPLYSCFVIPFPLFPPPLLFVCFLRVLFTYAYFSVCWFPISNCQQTIDAVCTCHDIFCAVRHLCHCCCERGRVWDWKHI